MLHLPRPWPSGEYPVKYGNCYLCSANKYKRVFLEFTSGSSEPSSGETLTGATSSASGVMADTKMYLYSGSWAGGDAAGCFELKNFSACDSYNRWGSDSENLNSTASNNVMTLKGYGHVKVYAMQYPDDALVEIDTGKYAGKKLCVAHAAAYMKRQSMDDAEIDLEEDEREGSPDLED